MTYGRRKFEVAQPNRLLTIPTANILKPKPTKEILPHVTLPDLDSISNSLLKLMKENIGLKPPPPPPPSPNVVYDSEDEADSSSDSEKAKQTEQPDPKAETLATETQERSSTSESDSSSDSESATPQSPPTSKAAKRRNRKNVQDKIQEGKKNQIEPTDDPTERKSPSKRSRAEKVMSSESDQSPSPKSGKESKSKKQYIPRSPSKAASRKFRQTSLRWADAEDEKEENAGKHS